MNRFALLGLRGAVALAGGGAMLSGLVFAFQGESAPRSERTQGEVATSAPAVYPTAGTTAASDPSMPAARAEGSPVPIQQPIAGAAPTSAPSVRPIAQPVAPPPTAAQPAADTPKYTDVAVLALAADVRLSTGWTFRECVELPPSHEKWPTPVHLYYEGKGKWLVETHVSEVQVVFDEATASFSVRNFAPTSPECLRSH